MELTDGYSEEAESWEADSGGHFADLAVTAFVKGEFEPVGGDVLTVADGRVAGRKVGVDALGFGRQCHFAFDDDTLAQFLQRFVGRLALDLRPISAGMGVFRIEKFGV